MATLGMLILSEACRAINIYGDNNREFKAVHPKGRLPYGAVAHSGLPAQPGKFAPIAPFETAHRCFCLVT